MSTHAVAETIADVTPEWLSSALSGPGEEVRVAGLSARRIGTGQVGTTYRLDISYNTDHAGGATGPEHLIAKLAAENPDSRQMVSDGYRSEVAFYQHVAPATDVRVPACQYAAISADALTFTLLLEDLQPATPGVQAEGCTPDQARLAALNVARLHAAHWNDPALNERGIFTAFTSDQGDFLAEVQADATEKFIERMGGRLGPDEHAVLRDSAAAAATWLTAGTPPFTVVHGDYRLDNLMFHPDGHEVIAVDWQTMAIGPGPRDIAYLLGTSLEVDARRDNEHALVAAYFDELAARGVTDYTAERCFRDYRLGQLQGPMITTLGSEFATAERTEAINDMFVAMATRSCTAIRDLKSLDLLG